MNDEKQNGADLHDRTAALLLLNKQERRLIRELLEMMRDSDPVRTRISRKLGEEYVEIGRHLLEAMLRP